jgi:hypothetical protein
MKKNIFAMAALLMASAAVFTACSSDDAVLDDSAVVNPTQKYIMTVNATKGDGTTRALSLSDNTLSVKWAATDEVSVFPEAWSSTTTLTPIGTLTAAASATGSTSLAGEVETTNLNTGDKLQMLFPRATWDYTGQKGVLLAEDDADNAIETKYDYALATPSITVSGTNEITANAAFESQQAIVKFNLQDAGGSAIHAKSLKIYANGGQLVQSRGMKKTYTPAGWEPVSGENKYYVYIETNWAIDISLANVEGYNGDFPIEFQLDEDYGTNGCQVVGGKYVYRFVFTKDYGDAPTQIRYIRLYSADISHQIYFDEYHGDAPIDFTNGMYLRQYNPDSNPEAPDKVQQVDVEEGNPVMASTYGALTVTPESAARELTVALRNELGADTYSFLVDADNGKTYTFSKSNVNFENGKYYEVTMKMTEAPQYVDLSTKTASYEAQDGDVLTGQLPSNCQLTIAADATVTLFNATVNYGGFYERPAVSCLGNATLVLMGSNTVTCNNFEGAGITPADGSTLTIQGNGILNVNGKGDFCIGIGYRNGVNGTGNVVINSGTIVIKANAAAIGAKYGSIGNITINGGNVTAYGKDYAAAIGCGYEGSCGNITITGGTVTAIGNGYGCTAIGTGDGDNSTCGDITISGGTVTAISGDGVQSVIGVGCSGTCSKVAITTGITSLTMTSGKKYDYGGIVSDFIKATAVYANSTDITTMLYTSVTDATVTTGMTAAGFATSYNEGTKTWTVTK